MNRRLYRSPDDRVLAGVAGGMAETYDIDPALLRVGWALVAILTGGVFLLVYIVMALVVPLRPQGMPLWSQMAEAGAGGTDAPTGGPSPTGYGPPHPPRRNDVNGAFVIGVLLILAGSYFLLRQFLPALDFGLLWPVAVIVLGGFLIVAAFARGSNAH